MSHETINNAIAIVGIILFLITVLFFVFKN
ncbi:LPXTG cell wall anchor domain-containing protein [Bacteroides sp. 51]|nr:LPXTG cell wall anchor domain-containing protein [Bacteroides sp. 51]